MKILVLVKSVPETTEVELEVLDGGQGVETDDLVFAINEWDDYAVEEAVRLKEAHGGSVCVLTLGDEEAEDVLRRALAMGADEALHVCDEAFEGSDPSTVARAFARATGERSFDLVLAGVQSSDAGNAQTGVLLAQALKLPYATMATKIEVGEGSLVIHRELESNTEERVQLPLPAVVTVQSGINQPRYVSVAGIRKARKLKVESLDASDTGLEEEDVGPAVAAWSSRTLSLPEVQAGGEILTGSLPEICQRTAQIIREKGGVL